MNKENKKMAQQKRAEERKRQERNAVIKKVSIAAIIVLFVGGVIIYGAIDAKKNSSEQADANSYQTQDESTNTNGGTGDTTQAPTLSTDETLEVATGDVVSIDYVGRVDGFQFQGGTGSYDLTIGSHSFIDDFEEQLVGHHVGEVVDVEVTFPDNYGRSFTDDDGVEHDLSGADATFTVTIKGIYQ